MDTPIVTSEGGKLSSQPALTINLTTSNGVPAKAAIRNSMGEANDESVAHTDRELQATAKDKQPMLEAKQP
ncbi:MAG: hypothetical protein R8M45_11880, partial [Ghiorsea sp.]